MRAEWPVAPPGVAFRDVEAGDEAFLRALYRETREAELASTAWDEAQKRAFADSQFDHQDRWYRANYAGAQFLVVLRDETPVGRLYLHGGPKEIRIVDLTLCGVARNQGLGTQLIRALQELAAVQGKALSLHVETFNRARGLYRRLGFREGVLDGVYVLLRWEAPPTGG
jgi:ribosomal protein S18 acetylase RimI-like enzyme